MGADKLVRMANQIAGFFRSYPDEAAAAGIREHVTAFWTPKMCAVLEAHAEAGGDGLDRLVRLALSSGALSSGPSGSRPAGPSPIDKETAGPARVGALGSDAG